MAARPRADRPETPPLIRLLPALLLLACGGATPTARPADFGALPRAAITVDVRPAALLAGLDAVQRRMGVGRSELGPLSEAWAVARQSLEDAAASMLPARASAPSLLAEWGIDGAVPIRVRIAAPQAREMGQALVEVLSGRVPETPPTVVAQLRARFGITELERVLTTLNLTAARIGLEVHRVGKGARPAWLGAEALPPALRWLARDPASGTWIALRVRDQRAALDLVVPPKTGPIAALLEGLRRSTPATGPPPEPLAIQIRPAEYTGLEAALAAHVGLHHPRPAVREASAEVLAACTTRWRTVADHAFAAELRLRLDEGRPQISARATLTPAGVAAWERATRPLPVEVGGLAAWRMGWHADAFGAPLGPLWIAETASCSAGNLALAGLGALALLPRILGPRDLPQPPLLAALPWDRVDGAAVGIVDLATLEGEAVPVIAAALLGAGPRPEAPLGPDAVQLERAGEVIWRAIGGAPVEIAWRPDRVRVGLGPDALRPSGLTASGDLFAIDVDAPALAARLAAAGQVGPELRALEAVGARFGKLAVRVARDGAALRLEASLAP